LRAHSSHIVFHINERLCAANISHSRAADNDAANAARRNFNTAIALTAAAADSNTATGTTAATRHATTFAYTDAAERSRLCH
jgi:hypothetical protein